MRMILVIVCVLDSCEKKKKKFANENDSHPLKKFFDNGSQIIKKFCENNSLTLKKLFENYFRKIFRHKKAPPCCHGGAYVMQLLLFRL